MKIIVFLVCLTFFIFSPFILKGKFPVPANYLVSWYEPWRTENLVGSSLGIAHKAVGDDILRQVYPFKKLAADLLRYGKLPLWNPYNGAGQPLLAVMHPGFLNPFSVITLIFPDILGWSLYVIFQFLLLGLAFNYYLGSLKLSFISRLIALILLLFSSSFSSRLVSDNYIYGLSVLPLLLGFVENYLSGDKKAYIYTPLAVAFLCFSVQPQLVFYVIAFFICYSYFRFGWGKKFLKILIFILLGVGCAGVQLIPTWELFRHANVTPASSGFIFDRFLAPLYHLITIFIPNYFGNQGTYNYWGYADFTETAAGFGLVGVYLASVGVIYSENKVTRFYIISILVIIAFTVRWFFTEFIYRLPIPIISQAVPARLFLFLTFSLAVLAGSGVEYLEKNLSKKIRKVDVFYLVLVMLFMGVTVFLYFNKSSCHFLEISQCRTIALRNTMLEVLVFFIIWFFLVIVKIIKTQYKYLSFKVINYLAVFVLVINGIYNSWKIIPFSQKEHWYPETDLTVKLGTLKDSGRAVGMGEARIIPDIATQIRIFDPNYYDPLYIQRYGEFVSFANNGNRLSGLTRSDINIVSDPIVSKDLDFRRKRFFNLSNVSAFIIKKGEKWSYGDLFWQDENWQIFTNPDSLPRAYLVSEFQVEQDPDKLLSHLFSPNFNLETKALLEEQMPVDLGPEKTGSDNVKITDYKEDKVVIETLSSGGRILVLSDNYYPGWKGDIDGKPTKIYRANYTFRAVVVPKGKHVITFSYWPESLMVGIYLSLSSLLFWFVWVFIERKRYKC